MNEVQERRSKRMVVVVAFYRECECVHSVKG